MELVHIFLPADLFLSLIAEWTLLSNGYLEGITLVLI